MTLVSPCCRTTLEGTTCSRCGERYNALQGLPVLIDAQTVRGGAFAAADRRYQAGAVPWAYDRTAPEVLKYEHILATCRAVATPSAAVADVGCSLGVLAEQLAEHFAGICAIDFSPSAALRAQQRLKGRGTFAAASATALPFPDQTFDVVVMFDGLVSWQLDREAQRRAVREAERVLKPGGHALFGDYLNPSRHAQLIEPVEEVFGPASATYLGDRLWYVTESVFRVLKGSAPYRWFAESLGWARALRSVSALAGRRGSKHLSLLVQRPAAPPPHGERSQ